MIGVEKIGEIRRAYFEQHRSIKEIVRKLSVSRGTVRKVVRGHQTEFKYERGVQPSPKLGAWVEILTEILEQEAKLPKRERRSTQRLFEELRGRGYDGAHDSVHRFVKAWRNERVRVPVHAYVPMSFAPGEAYQFDWSHETITLSGLPLTVKAAHMKLSHSRSDVAFVDWLAGQLVTRRHHIWMDRWELSIGDSLISKIQSALTDSDAMLIVLSKNSVASEWCKKELNSGLMRELEEKRVLVLPCVIDDCTIPLFMREKLYADFRKDRDEAFEQVDDALFAIRLWHLTKRGTRVIIAHDDVQPVEITNPHLFKPKAVSGSPEFQAATVAGKSISTAAATHGSLVSKAEAPEATSLQVPSSAPAEAAPRKMVPISVFVSRKLGKLFVRQGCSPLFDVTVKIENP